MGGDLQPFLDSIAHTRAQLTLFRDYAYEDVILDVLRLFEASCDDARQEAGDDGSVYKLLACASLRSANSIINWLRLRDNNCVCAAPADVLDHQRLRACQEAFLFASEYHPVYGAISLYKRGVYDCVAKGKTLEFRPLSQRMLWFRAMVDNMESDANPIHKAVTPTHRDTHIVSKLILLARLALGDALHFRFMHTVDLVLVMPLLCMDLMRCLK